MFKLLPKFSLLLIFTSTLCFSQKSPPVTLGLDFHYGFLLNHSPKSGNAGLSLGAIKAYEATVQFYTLGNRRWHHHYKFPRWGVSFIFYDIGVKRFGGNGFALLIHETFKLVKTDFFEFNFRLGTGIGHFSDPYNAKENPKNLWISAPLNPSLHFCFETRYKLSSQYQLAFSGTFTHFSNGATMMPNLGVNFPSLNLGLRYTPHPDKIVFRSDTSTKPLKKNFFHFSFAYGTKVLADYGTTYYPTYNISAQYGRRISKVSKAIIGLDGFRDLSLRGDSGVKASGVDINRLGLFAAHELVQGRLGFLTGLGYYLYNKTHRDAPIYLRVGLRYHVHRNIFIGTILKTHYGQADCIEWNLGFTL